MNEDMHRDDKPPFNTEWQDQQPTLGGRAVPLCFYANALCRSEQNSLSTPCLLVAFGGPQQDS